MHVFRSMFIEAPIEEVWAALRSFDGVVNWNPGITSAEMESGTGTDVGHIRKMDGADGSFWRETLLDHSDEEHFYSYDIVEGPLPVTNYVSVHRLVPITQSNQTLSIWEVEFDCAPELEKKMEEVVGDLIFVGGMKGLNKHIKGA